VFAKVDVDECAALAKACGVSCMPTFQVYVNGKKVGGMEGANKEKLEKLAAKYAAAA
jgi:thioredoxin 1